MNEEIKTKRIKTLKNRLKKLELAKTRVYAGFGDRGEILIDDSEQAKRIHRINEKIEIIKLELKIEKLFWNLRNARNRMEEDEALKSVLKLIDDIFNIKSKQNI